MYKVPNITKTWSDLETTWWHKEHILSTAFVSCCKHCRYMCIPILTPINDGLDQIASLNMAAYVNPVLDSECP